MEQESLVSPSAPKAPITVLPSSADDDNVSDVSSIVAEEEDFETASESDTEVPPQARNLAPLLPAAAMPVAKVTTEEEEEEEEDAYDEKAVVSDEKSRVSTVVESKDGVLGGGNTSSEDMDVVSGVQDGKDEILGGGSVTGFEENGNSDGGKEEEGENSEVSPLVENKDGVLGGETELAAVAENSVPESKVIDSQVDGGEAEKDGAAEVSGSGQPLEVPAAVAAHENNLDEAVVEMKHVDEVFTAEEDKAAADLDAGVEEPKVVETEHGALEPENFDGGMVELKAIESEVDAVEPENVDGGTVEQKAVESEACAVEPEKVVEQKAVESEHFAVEVKNVDDAMVEQKPIEEVRSIEPDNGVGGMVEQKVIEREFVADESDNIDHVVDDQKDEDREFVAVGENGDGAAEEPKATESGLGAIESENVAAIVEEPKSVERPLGAVEPENMDAVVVSAVDRSPETEVNAVPGSYQAPTDIEDETQSLSILVEDSKSKEKEGELSETSSVLNQTPNYSESKPDSVESLTILAEDSKGKEAVEEVSETLTVMENGSTLENCGGNLSDLLVDQEVEADADALQAVDDDESQGSDEVEEEEGDDGTVPDQPPRVAILDSSDTAKQIIKEMEEGSSGTSSISGFRSSHDFQHHVDRQIVSDSDEVDTDEDGDDKELFDPAALAALLKAAAGASSDGNITVTSQEGSRVFSVDRPAGLGNSAPALRPAAPRSTRPTLFSPSELVVSGEPENDMDEEEKKMHEKVDAIRVKFLRLVMRLGHSPEDTVAAQVLYRLGLAEGLRRGRQMARAFTIEAAKKKALSLELEGKDDLDFSCNILVLGKTGVGKSATINSIFGEEKSSTNAFLPATTSVKEISGVVDGVKIRVIDTPGLQSAMMDQASNGKILSSVKKYMKKCPPDIVLYVDRLDTQTRDLNDFPLLKSITKALGSSVWFNAIVALTHAASAPPEGPNGAPLGYESFISQRSSAVQHYIRQAAGDMRLMNPVALVENHPSCRRNREGQRVLPNGLSWRPQMLLLCYSSKILSEANALLKLNDPSPSKLFGLRFRSPPLPYLLSTLLQSRPHPKLSTDQGGDNGDSDIDLDDFSDEEEEEDEYDQLPPFKPLRKSQLAKLTKEQKRAYFDEYDYRVKLLQKKQWMEELRRMKEMKKRGKSGRDEQDYDMAEDYDQDGTPATVPVPLPDMVLPPSFDSEIPTYRYRFLEPTSQLLTRPVLDTHGWDHDCGYDGVSLEESLAIASRFPAAVAVQITKDKKEFNIHLDSSVSAKHGENGSTLAGFDIQTIHGKLAYIVRGESKFKNLKKNKTTAGVSVTFLGETVATGLKVEDQLSIGKRVTLVASTGAMRSQGDMAYGANLEARLREKDYPIGQALSTLGLSLMKWRSDLALGANLQTQLNIGRNSKVAVRVGINNKLSGQITVRTSTSEQFQLALVGILPVAVNIFRSIWPSESYLV